MPQTKEQQKISYEKNKEKILARNREYRERNKEKLKQTKKDKYFKPVSEEEKEKKRAYKLEWDRKRKEALEFKKQSEKQEIVKVIKKEKIVKQKILSINSSNSFVDNLVSRQENRNLTLKKSYFVK